MGAGSRSAGGGSGGTCANAGLGRARIKEREVNNASRSFMSVATVHESYRITASRMLERLDAFAPCSQNNLATRGAFAPSSLTGGARTLRKGRRHPSETRRSLPRFASLRGAAEESSGAEAESAPTKAPRRAKLPLLDFEGNELPRAHCPRPCDLRWRGGHSRNARNTSQRAREPFRGRRHRADRRRVSVAQTGGCPGRDRLCGEFRWRRPSRERRLRLLMRIKLDENIPAALAETLRDPRTLFAALLGKVT